MGHAIDRIRRSALLPAATFVVAVAVTACSDGDSDRAGDRGGEAPAAAEVPGELGPTRLLAPEGLGITIEIPEDWLDRPPRSGFQIVAEPDETGPFLLADRDSLHGADEERLVRRQQELEGFGATIEATGTTIVDGHSTQVLRYVLPDPDGSGAVEVTELIIDLGDGTAVTLVLGERQPTSQQALLDDIEATISVVGVDDTITVEHVGIDTAGFVGELRSPTATDPAPGVLLIGGSEGGTPRAAHQIARAGYPTFALAYFGEEGLPEALSHIPLEYFQTALRWLADRPEVGGNPVVVWGASRGGEAALLLGATYPDLVDGVIAHVPSDVVIPGHPHGGPSWTLGGEPLPWAQAFPAFDVVDAPDATIPVERITGPVLVTCGEHDRVWASCPMSRAVIERLELGGHQGPRRLVALADGDHHVGTPSRSLLVAPRGAGDEAWQAALELLDDLR